MLYALLHAAAVGCGFVIGIFGALFVLGVIISVCRAIDEGIEAARKKKRGR